MSNKSFYLSITIFVVTIAMVVIISRHGEPVVVKTNLENLPMEVLGFKATEDFFPDFINSMLNTDKLVYRHYRNGDGRQVDLYIGYYGTAKGGRTVHNPYACLPGSGWGIVDSRKIKVKTKRNMDGVEINYILAQKGEVYEVVLHWYQSAGDKILATGIQQNVQRFVGKVLYNRNDGAFIRISAFSEQKGIEEAGLLTKSFAEKFLDLIPHYWPVEE